MGVMATSRKCIGKLAQSFKKLELFRNKLKVHNGKVWREGDNGEWLIMAFRSGDRMEWGDAAPPQFRNA